MTGCEVSQGEVTIDIAWDDCDRNGGLKVDGTMQWKEPANMMWDDHSLYKIVQ